MFGNFSRKIILLSARKKKDKDQDYTKLSHNSYFEIFQAKVVQKTGNIEGKIHTFCWLCILNWSLFNQNNRWS